MSQTCLQHCAHSRKRNRRLRRRQRRRRSPVANTDLEELERDTIQRVFEQVNGDKARARKMLGISRATLYRKLKRYNIGFSKSATAAS